MSDLLRGVAKEGRDAAGVAFSVDKDGSLDPIVALPFNRKAGIGPPDGVVRDCRPWPDDRKLKLLYPDEARDEDGGPNSPEAQVKLHECFGAKEHPHICESKLPVKIWLATPDGKRLEATFNWSGFRANSYPKLKGALQKKFPATLWV